MSINARPILVIGGGIAGMTAAVEAAEVGHRVILVEKEAYLGGRVMRTHRYFPKMCPPACGFEINTRRLRQNSRITVHTLATVEEITGHAGNFKARIRVRPRYVTGTPSLDGAIADQLESERDNEFNLGLGRTKALYLPHEMAWPPLHVIDREALSDADAAKLQEACPAGAIDLDMADEELEVKVGAVVVATGWRPYDAARLDHLGYGRCANVVTNVMLERLAARDGPTGGKILRPSDGDPPRNVAFVQCAGSRDENHLPYCSAVCCMGSLKHVRYLREQDPEIRATVFYIDIRTTGRLEKFYQDMLDDEHVTFLKGKVAQVDEDAATGNLQLDVEDTLSRETLHPEFDLVVLATGIVPNTADQPLPGDLAYDEYGFVTGDGATAGVFAAGCATGPCDVSSATKEATGAALGAIQSMYGGD
ncbi:MAG: CoB--CoM heterodisulfide reductase iron-sulfur subunit A family protein [bacterium]|nr:CoB--CoM heterodisulfide reductase iron-sulfur subunit A family protein [bacterium]